MLKKKDLRYLPFLSIIMTEEEEEEGCWRHLLVLYIITIPVVWYWYQYWYQQQVPAAACNTVLVPVLV
jgi:hypothetical protein